MTDLAPGYVRAHNKKGAAVIIHQRDLTADYTADPLTPQETAALADSPAPVLEASLRAHEAAERMAENERAALTKRAADARAAYEAESIARRDAAAQAALDQRDIDAASAEAAVKVTEQKAATKKAPK
jgi:hypothetical protein